MAALASVACGEPTVGGAGSTGSAVAPSAPPAVAASAPLVARSALRCEECHEPYVRAWRGSTHARANEGAVYAAMRGRAGAACDRCHAPLLGLVGAADPIHAEGVTCDVCHSIRAVEGAGGPVVHDLRSERKYGPLCDAEDHYFHRMGCSPLHAEGRLCGACHQLEWPTPEGPLPVLSEFAEWAAAVDPVTGPSCQECHMTGAAGEVARGWPARARVADHAFLGEGEVIRGSGLELDVRALGVEAGGLSIEAEVVNANAGHALPAGVPGRAIVLVMRALDDEGGALAVEERAYARRAVDAEGREVPFYEARRIGEDTRLQAGERRTERWTAPGEARAIEAELWLRPLPSAIAASLGVEPPAPRLLLSRRVAASPAPGRYSPRGRRPPP